MHAVALMRCVLIAFSLAACIGTESDERAAADGACPAAADCGGDVCPIPDAYARDCDSDLAATEVCPAPYECTTLDDDLGPRSVCLVPCDDACDCPSPCICQGVSGHASWGPDHTCICV